jgi:tetratricopeptide (TPR) repeat protein
MAEYAGKEFLDQATQSLQGGHFQEALELVGNAIALSPDSADAYVLKGIAESQLNRPHEAIESFQKAIALDPKNAKAPYNLAVHYYGSGQKEEALAAARQAIEADPSHASARDLVMRIEAELNLAPPPVPGAPVESAPPVTPAAFTPVGDAAGYRQGYESPLHSLQWVENASKFWDTLGWTIALLTIAATVGIVAVGAQPYFQMINYIATHQNAQPVVPELFKSPWFTVAFWGSLLLDLASLVWMIFELIDRRGPWIWLLPYFVCCCCLGLQGAAMGAYLLFGRSKN